MTPKRTNGRAAIWIHALSVGEVLSAVPLVHAVIKRYPEKPVFFTATTRTGFQIATRQFKTTGIQVLFFPLDFHFAVKKAADHINPEWILLIETDLWPNFLREMGKRHVPVVLANARLSQRTLRGYRRFAFFFKPLLASLSRICVQSQTDLLRYQQAGVSIKKLVLTGNLKFDQSIPPISDSKKKDLFQKTGLSSRHNIVVAGSTHEGEEEMLIAALAELKTSRPDLRLVLAPRDPDRAIAVCRLARTMGQRAVTLTTVAASSHKPFYDLLVVDLMGVLRLLYAIADIAFVGGSLVACSGHNPLEPAAYAKPILFGPHMDDFLDISNMMLAQGGARVVADKDSLKKAIEKFLSDPAGASAMGRSARDIFEANKGAAQKILSVLERVLET